MPVKIALAGHRAFAANVERSKCVDLTGIGLADNHAELLLHAGIGSGWLHAAEFQRRPLILVEIGQDRRGFHGLGRKAQRRRCAHGPDRFRHGRAVLGQQQARDAVVGTCTIDVALHDLDECGLAGPDRLMHFGDRCLFQLERWIGLIHCRFFIFDRIKMYRPHPSRGFQVSHLEKCSKGGMARSMQL